MRTPHSAHNDVAAYVIGALDDDADTEFENHLAGCQKCQCEIRELVPVRMALEYAAELGLFSTPDWIPTQRQPEPVPVTRPSCYDRLRRAFLLVTGR